MGLGLLNVKLSRLHSDTPHSLWLLWTGDRQHSPASGRVRTRNSSKWGAKDPRLTRRVHPMGSGKEIYIHRNVWRLLGMLRNSCRSFRAVPCSYMEHLKQEFSCFDGVSFYPTSRSSPDRTGVAGERFRQSDRFRSLILDSYGHGWFVKSIYEQRSSFLSFRIQY